LNRRQFVAFLASTLSAGSVLNSRPVLSKNKPLILGIFPRRNIQTTYRLFLPLAEYLQDVLKQEVKLETTKYFPDFWKAVQNKRYDLVHFNQYHYVVSQLNYGYEVILRNKELGKSTIAGSLIVRKDSNINTVSDLKDKTVLFGGGKTAMQSYISAIWLLQKGGVNKGDYIEKFAINPPNTIISTFFKRADASGSGDVVMHLDNVTERIDISQLKFLAKTKPMPHLPWAVRADLPVNLKNMMTNALEKLSHSKEGKEILKNAKLDALIPTVDSDYDMHRSIIRDVYGDDYGASVIGK